MYVRPYVCKYSWLHQSRMAHSGHYVCICALISCYTVCPMSSSTCPHRMYAYMYKLS